MAADVITWARLRAPIGNDSTFFTGNAAKNNVTYSTTTPGNLFVSTDGLSMLRTYINPLNAIRVFSFPDFSYQTNGQFKDRATAYEGYRCLTDDQVDELIGETVTYTPLFGTGTSFVMTSAFWTNFGQPTSGVGPITAIGKLTIV
jgi:hypothetical protein